MSAKISKKKEPMVDVNVLAAETDIPVRTLYHLAKTGKIPSYRFGRQVRFRVGEVERATARMDTENVTPFPGRV